MVYPVWGRGGSVFTGQALAALVSFRVTLPFPQGDSGSFSGAGQHQGPPTRGGASSKFTTGCFLPPPFCHQWAVRAWLSPNPRLFFSPRSPRDQASCNYLTCGKTCHYQLPSFELKQDRPFSLSPTNINDPGTGSKFTFHRSLQNMRPSPATTSSSTHSFFCPSVSQPSPLPGATWLA